MLDVHPVYKFGVNLDSGVIREILILGSPFDYQSQPQPPTGLWTTHGSFPFIFASMAIKAARFVLMLALRL